MRRLVKILFLLLILAGATTIVSYAGARFQAGKVLTNNTRGLGEQTIRFAYRGVNDLPGHPRAWVIAHGPATALGMGEIRVYVSPKGKLLGTVPPNLAALIQDLRKREP